MFVIHSCRRKGAIINVSSGSRMNPSPLLTVEFLDLLIKEHNYNYNCNYKVYMYNYYELQLQLLLKQQLHFKFSMAKFTIAEQIQLQLQYTGWPRNNGTVDTDDFSRLCSDQQLSLFTLLDRASFSHYINTKIIKFDWELFILWTNFLWTVIFRISLSFEVRWHINGKSRKWLSIRNYS